MLDRFDCYELCVQSPRHITGFLRAVHGGEPLILREDFCGTAAVSRRWGGEAGKRGDTGRAVAADFDAQTVARAKELIVRDGVDRCVRLVQEDCFASGDPEPADVVFVGNFSIGYAHDRPTLLKYLRGSRDRLARGNAGFGGGVFVCDTYGGASAFKLGGIERRHSSREREVIRYSWLHEAADPITARVRNSISFRVELDGDVVRELPRAFVYDWRLWSIAELRDAMLEAGFASIEVHKDVNLAPGEPARPVTDPAELGEDWIVLVVGRA